MTSPGLQPQLIVIIITLQHIVIKMSGFNVYIHTIITININSEIREAALSVKSVKSQFKRTSEAEG